jgi:predicted MPP superfamily phosphohydrolase
LQIWYQNPQNTAIDSVCLKGPFNRITLLPDSVITGLFEFDTYTQASVNNMICVRIPPSAPQELYDVQVYNGGQHVVSEKSVQVVRAFKAAHRFIHISDPHVSRQWVGTATDGYAKELELLNAFIKVANIIDPDFIIITGDLIHHYTMLDADSTGWGGHKFYTADQRPTAAEKYRNYFDGAKGFLGIHGFASPCFSAAGNHDFYGVKQDDYPAKAQQWNDLCGLRVYGFSYAGTRVFVADDYLGDPVVDIPDRLPMSGLQGRVLERYLETAGPGDLRILAQHRPDRIDTLFVNKLKIGIVLNGHHHEPFQEHLGSTPTISIRSGAVCRSGEITRWQKTLGFFRIFSVNKDTVECGPPLRFCKNPTAPYQQLELNLTLAFAEANDGSSSYNKAVLHNAFPVDLDQTRIRFVMKKGEYEVTGADLEQVIDSRHVTVIDVRASVASNAQTMVFIKRKQNR